MADFSKKKKNMLFTYNSENSRNWLVLGSNLSVSLEISFLLDSVAVLWQVVAVCFLQHKPHQGRQPRSTDSCHSPLHIFPRVALRCFCETEMWPFLRVSPSCPWLGSGTLHRTSALYPSARITRRILIYRTLDFITVFSHMSVLYRTLNFIVLFLHRNVMDRTHNIIMVFSHMSVMYRTRLYHGIFTCECYVFYLCIVYYSLSLSPSSSWRPVPFPFPKVPPFSFLRYIHIY